jgi:hypothetical protein
MTKKTHITSDMIIRVTAKAAKNPFTEGTKQHKRAAAVLSCNGKSVEAAKKKGADQWTVRFLAQNKIIAVADAT